MGSLRVPDDRLLYVYRQGSLRSRSSWRVETLDIVVDTLAQQPPDLYSWRAVPLLAGVVGGKGLAAAAAERAEIDHPARGRPRKGVKVGIASDVAAANDLTAVGDCSGGAIAAAERAKIDHPARGRPQKRVKAGIAHGIEAVANDLAGTVDRKGLAIAAAERAEVGRNDVGLRTNRGAQREPRT